MVVTDLQLKQYFETGDFPTQQQFHNFIDSKVSVLNLPTAELNIGVTPILNGYENSILFQQSGRVQENQTFVYDPVNSRIGMDELAPLTRMHLFSTTGNTDAAPLTFTFQRDTDTYNSNTTWFSHRAINGTGIRVGAFAFAQQAVGQGTRFSILTTNDSTNIAATEALRVSQEKRLSIGTAIYNGAVVDIAAEGNLSTDLSLRVRNYTDGFDHFRVQGNGGITAVNNQSTRYLNHIDESYTGSIVQIAEWRNGNSGGLNDQTVKLTNYRWNYSDPLLAASSVLASNTYATSVKNSFIINNANNNSDSAIVFNISTAESTVANDALRLTALRNILIGGTNLQAGISATNTLVQLTGVAPGSDITDSYQLYSKDITAGNAAPHFRTENGSVVKLYQQNTALAAATVVSGTGGSVKHDDTFDGYTLQQVVKALRNLGILA